jgi:hypothetical protein
VAAVEADGISCVRHREEKSGKELMDALTAFGLFAVTAMLVCYAAEDRSPWFILAFAAACALGSIYGFLQGAWPFGLVRLWRSAAGASEDGDRSLLRGCAAGACEADGHSGKASSCFPRVALTNIITFAACRKTCLERVAPRR